MALNIYVQRNIVTKGVASVRSPVCNLQKYSTSTTHETFTFAVAAEFRKEYGVTSEVRSIFPKFMNAGSTHSVYIQPCIFTEGMGSTIEYIRSEMEELKVRRQYQYCSHDSLTVDFGAPARLGTGRTDRPQNSHTS